MDLEEMKIFREFKDKDALLSQIVGKNMFDKNKNDYSVFYEYFQFCLDNAKTTKDEKICHFMLKEAEDALQTFSICCSMDENMLNDIKDLSIQYTNTVKNIAEENDLLIIKENKAILEKIKTIYDSLVKNGKKEELLKELSLLDKSLVKELFNDADEKMYQSLSDSISRFLAQQKIEEQRIYNKTALNSFKKCYDLFNEDKKYRKEENELRSLLKNYLFKYDNSLLSQEVNIYYNYVFKCIFDKVKEDYKFLIIGCSINF